MSSALAHTSSRLQRKGVGLTLLFLAIDTTLARLNSCDLCLILIDQVEEALAHIAKRCAEWPAGQPLPIRQNFLAA